MAHKHVIAGLAVVALAVAGCGSKKSSSSGSSGTSSASTPTSTAKGGKAPSRTYNVKLSGAAETPPGAPKGTGKATITLRGKKLQVCWNLKQLKGIDKPTAAHIHAGPAGTAGPVIVPLSTAAKFHRKGCVKSSAATITAIASNPSGYYVNVHTKKYPNGAIRSQL
jgi:hypothetical protein